jgi:hypothetical protein
MTPIYRIISQLSWVLGLLSILAGFLIKLLHLEAKLTVASHTAFLVAGAFFLCALATREIQRA